MKILFLILFVINVYNLTLLSPPTNKLVKKNDRNLYLIYRTDKEHKSDYAKEKCILKSQRIFFKFSYENSLIYLKEDAFEDVKKYNDKMQKEFDELDSEVLSSLDHLKNIADLPINQKDMEDEVAEDENQSNEE